MSAPVCLSRFGCFLNGLFGTAVALCAVALAWAVFDLFQGGLVLGEAALLFPALCVLVGAGVLRVRHQPAGPLAWAGAILAAVWTVAVLNAGVSL